MGLISLGTVNIDGVVTGLDTTTLIDELASAAGRNKTLMETKKTALQTKNSLFATLNTRLSALDAALEAVQDEDDFREFSVTTEDDASYSVTATGEASSGSFDITVSQIAKAQIFHFETNSLTEWSSATDTIFSGAGDVSITLDGGTAETISVTTTTTLSDFAGQLNALDGITAYVVQVEEADETGGSDRFSLVVQADETGQNAGGARIAVSDDFSGGSTDSEIQAATNALVDVGGTRIESASNTITSIEGMTINAKRVDATSYTTTIALDTSAMADKVSGIVDAFNSIVSLISTNSSFTSSGTNQDGVSLGAFVGESTPRTILNRLRSILSTDYASALSISGTTSGSQMGISTKQSGLLTFTAADFIEALEDNQSDVESLFSDTSGSLADALRDELDVYIEASTGIIAQNRTTISEEIDRMDEGIDAAERRIAKFKARLRKQFTGLETITSSLKTTSSFLTSFFAPKSSS